LNEGNTCKIDERNGSLDVRAQNANFRVGVTHAKQRQRRRRGASLDGGDRRVDLERLGNRNAALGAKPVACQAAKRGGNKIGMIEMLLPHRSNKNTNFKVGVTHAKQRQRRRRGASLDGGDRRVDLERLGDRDATLAAEIGAIQAAETKM
jgi:hypothetical protein